MSDIKPEIQYDDFAKLDIRVGKITTAEPVEGSEKLIKETVDFGEFGTRTILSGIRASYEPEALVGRIFMFVVNLAPCKMMGLESQGMIIAAHDSGDGAVLYSFDKDISPSGLVS